MWDTTGAPLSLAHMWGNPLLSNDCPGTDVNDISRFFKAVVERQLATVIQYCAGQQMYAQSRRAEPLEIALRV